MKTIKEIMVSSPKYCTKQDTLQNVAEQMSKFQVGSLPVLDENKKVVGMLTDRDVCLSLEKEGNKPASEIKVRDVLTNKQVYTCASEDNLQTVLKTMRTKQVRRLPVVDGEKKLRGIVTLGHILREAQGSEEEAEVQYGGEENIIKTLRSLAYREPDHVY